MSELYYAEMEAARNESEDAYFAARTSIDSVREHAVLLRETSGEASSMSQDVRRVEHDQMKTLVRKRHSAEVRNDVRGDHGRRSPFRALGPEIHRVNLLALVDEQGARVIGVEPKHARPAASVEHWRTGDLESLRHVIDHMKHL